MEILGIIFAALIGLAVGSFLNVCIDRLPAGKSVVHPPSFCDSCNTPLARKDMFPVFSYLWLRGRCRACGAVIPRRVLLVEILGGLIFALLYWQFGLSLQSAVFTFYFLVLLLIFFIDLEHQLILNKIVYPVAIVVLAIDILLPHIGMHTIHIGVPQAGVSWLPAWVPQPAFLGALPSGVFGGVIGFTVILIPGLIKPGGMGEGDMKFAGLMGLMTGLVNVFVALMLGIVMGGVVAAVLLVTRRKKRGEGIPFGPFLAVGTAVTLLWGQGILHWYLSFFVH